MTTKERQLSNVVFPQDVKTWLSNSPEVTEQEAASLPSINRLVQVPHLDHETPHGGQDCEFMHTVAIYVLKKDKCLRRNCFVTCSGSQYKVFIHVLS